MCLYYHNNNHNHNIMCYNNNNKNNNNNNTLSSFKTSTTNVIAMPSRRQSKIRQQTTQINSSIKNIFSDFITTLSMHQSGVVVMWWCFILCTSFILDVSGSPVIRIQKDLVSAKDNANSSLNLGCAYKGNVYSHRSHVQTEEPCLNCTCSHSTLICYLRVCPDLPDPPPVGCIVLQRYQVCCPELICTENRKGGNRIESRSELDASLFPHKSLIGEGCVSNGTIYAEGSAMLSSSECEHCFCLAGHMNCVKPKCLLPLKGCEPIYEKNSCCPIRYDCLKHNGTTSTTEKHQKEVCYSNGSIFYEGEKVVVPGHSKCDNCYCFHGKIHCEPLSCAPTLMGCEPIIPPEKCCATSYNCSGTIEVKPNGFYAKNPPDVSKNYAKLRKEQHVKYISNESNRNNVIPTEKNWRKTISQLTNLDKILNENYTATYNSLIDGRNNRRIDRPNNQTNEISNHIDDEIFTTTSMEDLTTTLSTIDTTVFTTTESIFESTTTEMTTENDENITTTDSNLIMTTINSMDDGNQTKYITNENMSYKSKTEIITVENCSITNDNSSVVPSNSTIIYTKTVITTNFSNGTNKFKNNTIENSTETLNVLSNKNLVNSTHDDNMKIDNDKNNETITSNNIQTKTDDQILEDITSEIAEAIKEELLKSDDASIKELNITGKNHDNSTMNMSMKTLSPDIEAILNITKIKNHDFEDYDYNEPSLPPSLPNLKIIPFVAADAVDETIDTGAFSNLPKDKILVSENPFRYDNQPINLFSPPIETEGGFLPRDPPIIDSFYDNSYHTTNIVDITSVTPVPSITNPPKINEICFSKGREYKHGELLSAPDSCILCMCFFGDIVCQEPKCPPLKPGCTRLPVKDQLSCCGHVICDNESPTVVLDRIDATSNSQNTITIANRITTPDPFRDVIRTEPAPDLQSLIGDIIPFLKSQETTTIVTTTTVASTTPSNLSFNEYNKTKNATTEVPITQITTTIKSNISEDSPKISIPVKDDEDDFSFDKVLELLFASETTTKTSTTTVKSDTSTDADLIESRIVNNNFDNGINYLPLKFPSNLEDRIEVNNGINSSIKSTVTPISISTTTEPTPSPTTTTEKQTLQNLDHSIHHNKLNEAHNSVGLLKLAGCNIYGRMYRVGRIISELSGPCLECMCTDIGVQCRPLKC